MLNTVPSVAVGIVSNNYWFRSRCCPKIRQRYVNETLVRPCESNFMHVARDLEMMILSDSKLMYRKGKIADLN